MNSTPSPDLFKDTPTIIVNDNRGLSIRTVAFNRQSTSEALDTRITRTTYNALGQLSSSADPRLFTNDKTNLSQINSLTGQPLRMDSVDAGWRLMLPDIEGSPHKEWQQRGTVRRYDYDTSSHRPTAIYEQRDDLNDGAEQVTERFVYGQATDADKQNNLNLQLIRHYDSAGMLATTAISLTGQPLNQQRQLLVAKTTDSDWQGDTETTWQQALATPAYTNQWTYNALGIALTQIDAKNNQQRSEYDVAGALSATYLQLANTSSEQIVVSAIGYNANGQKTTETAGNGVITSYHYDNRDWRLLRMQTTRPAQGDRTTLLQDLHYGYDPVGNIISVNDGAVSTRFYKNQRVSAQQTYAYDALYQLISASGRENDGRPPQDTTLPPLQPYDSHQYVNYTRRYDYDRAGNLYGIHHNGASEYTLDMVVSDKSNRVVQQHPTTPILPDAVDSYFDVHGNPKQLEHSKALVWGRYDQLTQVTLTDHQQENYQYANQGQRLRKRLIDSSTHREAEVIYLPGLEQRITRNNTNVTEDLSVTTLTNTGRNQVRLLHWEIGRPSDIPNDQLRYSLDNPLGSSHLELNQDADILTYEEYYPFGGTAVWSASNQTEAQYKFVRYSGKERDMTGLYYYGHRYYAAWMGRWLTPDPSWTVDGLNFYWMVKNNPVNRVDMTGQSTLVERLFQGITGLITGDIQLPSLSLPSFSFPSFSLPSFSLPSVSPATLIRIAARFVYRKAFKKVVNHILSKAKTDEQRIKYVRYIKAVGIGIGLGATALTTLASAGVAPAIVAGVTIGASVAGGAMGYFSSKIASGFSWLLRKLPGKTATKSAAAAQVGNLVSGGNAQSAANTALIEAPTSQALKAVGKSSEVRIEAGAQIGVAAGTDVQINAGKPGATTQYTAPLAASFAAFGAEKASDLHDAGEIAAMSSNQGARLGKSWDEYLGLDHSSIGGMIASTAARMTLGNTASSVVDKLADKKTGVLETTFSMAQGSAATWTHVRTKATNNFEEFRHLSFD
ncbi:hypothetical protein AB835_05480 [Candidatus Endobugula sertula]|uniref:Insecticidal toxin complex protein TccC n=1 Tax=Candidatus Endobugula sertula TaxID=62101 RepID=A0A1D2QR62_9GAMM|nr:hypothetical protein AB835_05480 [Candidatus Endobugula sertula]